MPSERSNRQTRLAFVAKYLGVGIGALATVIFIHVGRTLPQDDPPLPEASLYFYPLCFVSIIAWIAAIVMLVGLRIRSRSSYMQLAAGDDDFLNFMPQISRNSSDETLSTPTSTSSSDSELRPDTPSVGATAGSGSSTVDKVKSAFEETFGVSISRPGGVANSKKFPLLLTTPRPHFRMIRSLLPHYFHGYTADGHLIVWDFLGQVKMDRLHTSGFTTTDIGEHYRFFVQYAVHKLLKAPTQRIVYVIDLEGLTLTDTDDRVVESAKTIVSALQLEFPEKVQTIAVLNAPVWFSQVMAAIKKKIPKRTMDKVVFYRSETMTSDLIGLLGVDSLPRRYGGRNGVEIGKSSQERSLDELLRRTTGSLEQTIEIIGGRKARSRSRASSIRSDDGASDEEAFFDSMEYGLQDDFDDEAISIVVHSQSTATAPSTTEAVVRSNASAHKSPEKPAGIKEEKPHSTDRIKPSSKSSEPEHIPDLTISREPLACLVLLVYFFWQIIQISFDEMLPLWFFEQNPISIGKVHSAPIHSTVSSMTVTIAGTLAISSLAVLVFQFFCCSFSSATAMTPLATLRVGLLLQIPLLGCFPLIDLFKVDELPFAWVIVIVVIVVKHLFSGVALHGIVMLLDNSIAVDRRLAVHRAAQMVSYASLFLASSIAPALFALMGYFEKGFPFDQSLLYFVETLGLIFLLLFSLLIPSRLNFPQLFVMGKR
jgi:hypothetical protein